MGFDNGESRIDEEVTLRKVESEGWGVRPTLDLGFDVHQCAATARSSLR